VQEKRYDKKFKQFKLEGNNIIFKPLKLMVVEKANIKGVLENEFESDGLGRGVLHFYKHIQSKFINIRREDVRQFMEKNAIYQTGREQKHRVQKPIIAKSVGELWAVYLIDMNAHKKFNRGYRYIFTCIDVFSRRLFVEKLKESKGYRTRKH
jgi:hypothetical protein